MRISYNWLKEFVDIKTSPQKLGEDLSLFGFPTESIQDLDDDTILDLEINPNRGDCLSIFGIAREIAALYNLKLKSQKTFMGRCQEKVHIDKNIRVSISDPRVCLRYTARIIDGIEIKPSSPIIQQRLRSYGIRPINNVVDATNYVMVETGQPLHAFDFDKIKAGKVLIDMTSGIEEVISLDGRLRKLPPETIIISDEDKVYDLAGIMGGRNSEVDKDTKTILLQAAVFNPILIRRASKSLNLTTEASYRYERGVDYSATITALERATGLLSESSPHILISDIVDIKTKQKNQPIRLDLDKVNRMLGTKIEPSQADVYLRRLNFEVSLRGKNFQVKVPSFRLNDVKIWQDLAEEIVRVSDIDGLKSLNLVSQGSIKENQDWKHRHQLRELLRSSGWNELFSYSFIDKKQADLLDYPLDKLVEIANPISKDYQYLRPSLAAGLLSALAKNPWAPEITFFEIGKVFKKSDEIWQLGLITCNNPPLVQKTLDALKLSSDIKRVNQNILDFYKIRRNAYLVVVNLDAVKEPSIVFKSELKPIGYREISKFPPAIRDLAFICATKVDANKVLQEIKAVNEKIFLVELFDEFRSEKFGQNKKNIAFHLWLQELHQPMAEQEVEEILSTVTSHIEEKFQSKLRKF